jgi:hypothetical protein
MTLPPMASLTILSRGPKVQSRLHLQFPPIGTANCCNFHIIDIKIGTAQSGFYITLDISKWI